MARDLKRLNTNMPIELIERIDAYALSMGINRTSAINSLVAQSLETKQAVNTLDEFMKMIKSQKNEDPK